jgi:hypothetical protein
MGFLLSLAVFCAFPALVAWLVFRDKRTRQEVLDAVAASMDGAAVDREAFAVRGRRHGVSVVFQLAVRGSGKQRQTWTEVLLPPAPAGLSLELRPQTTSERSLIEKGLAVDVQVGDPAFDAAFVVEAAPAYVARTLLDADVRRKLLLLDPVSVVPVPGGGMRLEKWAWNTLWAATAVDAAALLASRMPHAFEEAERALEKSEGGPYRPAADVSGVLAARMERAREHADLEAVRAARTVYQQRQAALWVGVVVALFTLALMLRFWWL